jgi:hypothetical protein
MLGVTHDSFVVEALLEANFVLSLSLRIENTVIVKRIRLIPRRNPFGPYK